MINYLIGYFIGLVCGVGITCIVVVGKESEQKLNGRTNIRKTK